MIASRDVTSDSQRSATYVKLSFFYLRLYLHGTLVTPVALNAVYIFIFVESIQTRELSFQTKRELTTCFSGRAYMVTRVASGLVTDGIKDMGGMRKDDWDDRLRFVLHILYQFRLFTIYIGARASVCRFVCCCVCLHPGTLNLATPINVHKHVREKCRWRL